MKYVCELCGYVYDALAGNLRSGIVPGTAFGDCGEGFARVSYAYSVNHISTAIEKISEFVKKIKNN